MIKIESEQVFEWGTLSFLFKIGPTSHASRHAGHFICQLLWAQIPTTRTSSNRPLRLLSMCDPYLGIFMVLAVDKGFPLFALTNIVSALWIRQVITRFLSVWETLEPSTNIGKCGEAGIPFYYHVGCCIHCELELHGCLRTTYWRTMPIFIFGTSSTP